VHALAERLSDIEDVQPAVMAERLQNLSNDVKNMTRAFWGLVIVIIAALATLAFAHIG
jgi:hypothetical protein